MTPHRRSFVILFAALLATPGALALQLATSPPTGPKIGEPAPAFEVVDTTGRKHRLEDYRDRIVILEWTNPNCPYVERQYRTGAMPETYQRVRTLAPTAVWLAIDSTFDATKEKAAFWIQQHKLEYPIILDLDGALGRRYDARRTPHMFVIDGEGKLRYEGAIDDNGLGTRPKGQVTNYVVDAVRRIAAGEAVAPDHVKPYGCSVKYRR